MLRDLDTRNLIDSADEFQRQVLEELSEHVRRCEEEVAETGRAVLGDFTVGDDDRDEPILRICFLCEPGQEVQVVSVDGVSADDWPPATFH
jgi:hypothetical protein